MSATGIGGIFVEVVLRVVKRSDIKIEYAHLDATSMSVHGEYKSSSVEIEEEGPKPIKITHGYSRAHRPDLKQCTMQLICSGDIPLWMKMGDGNASEQKEFPNSLKEFLSSF